MGPLTEIDPDMQAALALDFAMAEGRIDLDVTAEDMRLASVALDHVQTYGPDEQAKLRRAWSTTPRPASNRLCMCADFAVAGATAALAGVLFIIGSSAWLLLVSVAVAVGAFGVHRYRVEGAADHLGDDW